MFFVRMKSSLALSRNFNGTIVIIRWVLAVELLFRYGVHRDWHTNTLTLTLQHKYPHSVFVWYLMRRRKYSFCSNSIGDLLNCFKSSIAMFSNQALRKDSMKRFQFFSFYSIVLLMNNIQLIHFSFIDHEEFLIEAEIWCVFCYKQMLSKLYQGVEILSKIRNHQW